MRSANWCCAIWTWCIRRRCERPAGAGCRGTLKVTMWTKVKLAALAGVGILLVSGTTIHKHTSDADAQTGLGLTPAADGQQFEFLVVEKVR